MYQYNVATFSALSTKLFVWFVSSEFRWLLEAVNRYLPCSGVRDFIVLGKNGGLIVNKSLKRVWNGKKVGETMKFVP